MNGRTCPVSHLIFLAHTPDMRRNYYGEEALAELRTLGPVQLHEGTQPLDGAGLVAAAQGTRVIVADRMTPGPAEVFADLPDLVAFVRVAVDIRNIDVEAASAAGVLVTRAGPGFVDSVVELTLGLMIDLSRGISRAVRDYQAGRMPAAPMGRQLSGATRRSVSHSAIGR